MTTSEWAPEAWTNTLQDVIPPPAGDTDLTQILRYWNFDDYALGSNVENVPGITNTASTSATGQTCTVVTDPLNSGRHAAKDTLPPNTIDGFPAWGCIILTPDMRISQGEEAWIRVFTRFLPSFTYKSDAGAGTIDNSFKVIRFKTRDGPEWDSEINYQQTTKVWAFSPFGRWNGPDSGGWSMGTAEHIDGQWHCIEMYIRADSGRTNGNIRVWHDGIPLDDQWCNGNTLSTAGDDYIKEMLWYTWWDQQYNNDTNYAWWRDMAMAVRTGTRDDTAHMDTDSNGFPFIGLAT